MANLRTLLSFVLLLIAANVFADDEIKKEFSIGVVPQQSASKLARSWVPITRYLKRKTGYRFRFVTAKNIPAFEKVLAKGGYDFSYMNPYHYTVYSRQPGYRAFARARDKKIKGILVVRKDSQIHSLEDLQNAKIAFPSPLAFAASLLPRAELAHRGIKFEANYVNSHDSVYGNVAHGYFPAGGGVMRTFKAANKKATSHLRVLYTTDGYTPHALAAHPAVPAEVVHKVQQAFVEMEQDGRGAALLKKLKIKGFRLAQDQDWDDVRQLELGH